MSYGQVPFSQPIKILRSIFRTISKTTSLSQPIKSFRSILRMISKTTSPSRPIKSLRSILRTISKDDFHIGQSHPSDGSSFGRTFVLANHILRTDHPLDGLFYRPITSFGRIILRTDFRIGQSHPSDGSSFGRTFVSTNQNPSENPPDDLQVDIFVSTNQNLSDKPSREASHLNGQVPHE